MKKFDIEFAFLLLFSMVTISAARMSTWFSAHATMSSFTLQSWHLFVVSLSLLILTVSVSVILTILLTATRCSTVGVQMSKMLRVVDTPTVQTIQNQVKMA